MNRAIKSALRRPVAKVFDVRTSDLKQGDEYLIEIQQRGRTAIRYHTVEEVLTNWPGYRAQIPHDIFFVAADVPADIRSVFE